VWLARTLALSRAQARRLLTRGQVQLNGQLAVEADKGRVLCSGDGINVEAFVAPALQSPIPQPQIELSVVAQGDGWVVIDKPAGMAVHPLAPDERDTVLNGAIARWPELAGVGEGGLRSGVVHRLDVDTSGCLAIATRQH